MAALDRLGAIIPGPSPARGSEFLEQLELALDEPIEAGVSHPVEDLFRAELARSGAQVGEWLNEIRPEQELFGQALGVLSRVATPHERPWLLELASKGLASQAASVRYAAVKALEHWRDEKSTRLLKKHSDRERWLADYVGRVVARR